MPCTAPLNAYRSPEGISFRARGSFTDLNGFTIPCGQCLGCKMDKAKWWGVRVAHEASLHEANCFLTLTYDEDHLPDPPSVDKRALQLFMKRARKKLHDTELRFFACGEYGGKDGRPHYHVILFGHDFHEDRVLWSKSKSGFNQYRSPTLEALWPFGHSIIGDFAFETGTYVARYTMKKTATNRERLNAQTGEFYQVDEEFLLMSRRPGVGSGWWDKYQSEVFPNDFVIINGTRFPVPPYYANKIKDTALLEKVKAARRQRGLEHGAREEAAHASSGYGQARKLTKHLLALHDEKRTQRDNGES